MTTSTQTPVASIGTPQLGILRAHFVSAGQDDQVQIIDAELERRANESKSSLDGLRAQILNKVPAPKPAAPTTMETVETAPPSIKDRPRALDELVGQENLVLQLRLVIEGCKLRGVKMVHTLLVGASGCGKTTVCRILAEELGYKMVEADAVKIKRAEDLEGLMLRTAGTPTILYVDEVHQLPIACQESIYGLMEDGRVNVLVGKGGSTEAMTKELPDLLICASTTRPGALAEPFKMRYGFIGQVDSYDDAQIAEIVRRSWERVDFTYGESEPLEVARRSQGVPRKALKRGELVLNYAQVMTGQANVLDGMAGEALNLFGVDQHGLEPNDYLVLECLVRDHCNQPVGLATLATETGLDPQTIENDHEPFLLKAKLVARTPGGRVALPAAYGLIEEREKAAA